MKQTHGGEAFTRRRFLGALAVSLGYYGSRAAGAGADRLQPRYRIDIDEVIPRRGANTSIVFGDAIRRLVAAGALDPDKYRAVLAAQGRLPAWVEQLFAAPSASPIVLSQENAPYLLHLLWPLGLSTRAGFNQQSPIRTVRLPSFASTAGWTLGRANNGYIYFDQVDAVRLTHAQEATALEVATTTFRPCCDNSTFFQDCNHGSALLGLIELGASQGASLDHLYRVARVANSFWFPSQYAMTAMYFAYFQQQPWPTVSPRLALGPDYSSASGWQRNVADALAGRKASGPPTQRASASCGMPSGADARAAAPQIVRRE